MTLQSYEEALNYYEISATRFSLLRKRATIVLISGMVISLLLFGAVLIRASNPPLEYSGFDHASWDQFLIAGLFLLCAISCGFAARDAEGFYAPPVSPEEISEQELSEEIVITAGEEIDENNEFLKTHKNLTAASLILFLIANLMLIQY